jgi:23S rRNA (cytidine1920-2'-O)/16S rRNA (cytidine1409-2'-O)-methyltransferase
MPPFVSRAGAKLDHALSIFSIDVTGKICADLGCSTGGFTDCLLQRGAAKVYAIDTGYGVLDWKLRNDPRVIVMERTNAMHLQLPQLMHLITIDASWTRQAKILPSARKLISAEGLVIALIKPHYEADRALLRKGVLPEENVDGVVKEVKRDVAASGFVWINSVTSPIKGTGGNMEVLALLQPIPLS